MTEWRSPQAPGTPSSRSGTEVRPSCSTQAGGATHDEQVCVDGSRTRIKRRAVVRPNTSFEANLTSHQMPTHLEVWFTFSMDHQLIHRQHKSA